MNKFEVELQGFLMEARRSARGILPPLRCADGFELSVQVGSFLYCTPRSDVGPWTHVEVGYPSHVEPLLWPYAETPGDWTNTVYPYTPVEVLAAVVELHDGFTGWNM